jgi:surface antigen
MVTWESWAGHVAYVEAVNPDGSWVVSEMNWTAFDVIDERTIRPGQLGSRLVGFIYGS